MTTEAPLILSETTQTQLNSLNQHPALNRLVLTGFMGCGKSTLGRKLSSILGFRFVDTDNAIEKRQRRKIPDIFKIEGEAAFRTYEKEILEHYLKRSRVVIATGGGALVQQDNLDLALDHSLVIYIEMDEQELLDRVLFSPKERPLINVKNPHDVVERLFVARRPFYEQAQVHVQTGGLKPSQALEAVIEGLYNYVTYFLPSVAPVTLEKGEAS